jgi:hypothetical protein
MIIHKFSLSCLSAHVDLKENGHRSARIEGIDFFSNGAGPGCEKNVGIKLATAGELAVLTASHRSAFNLGLGQVGPIPNTLHVEDLLSGN